MTYIEKKKINGQTYYYLVKKKYDAKKKNSVRVFQIKLGKINEIEEKINSPKPKKIKSNEFGCVFAIYETIQELGINKIIQNLKLNKQDAELLEIAIINRATKATSKNQLSDWFEKTSLTKIYNLSKKEIQSYNYSRLSKKINSENIDNSLTQLLENLQKLGIDTTDIILDNTNYTTRIQKTKNLKLPQLGKPKNGKWGDLQININMIVSKDGQIPLYYKPYEGNINDPTFFKNNREKLIELSSKYKTGKRKVTMSIDAGHNSQDNVDMVKSKYDFIGTLRPSMCKNLMQKSVSEFKEIIELENDENIKIYSEKREIYGEKYFVVVSEFSITKRKSIYTLNNNIDKAITEMKLFEADLNATFKAEEKDSKKRKTKFHDVKNIEDYISKIICRKEHVKKILETKVELVKNEVLINVGINEKSKSKIVNQLGRAIRFTNREDLSAKEVIEYYQNQYVVEHQFRDLKNPHLTSLMPMFHHTNEGIEMFLFTNYLALVVLSYMVRKVKNNFNVSMSKSLLVRELTDLKEIILFFEGKITSMITEKNEVFQEKMYGLFDLDKYYEMNL